MNYVQQELKSYAKQLKDEAELLIEMGKKEGMFYALQERQELLVSLLKEKYGFLPPAYQNLIEKASAQQILNWCKKLLFANSLQEIFMEKKPEKDEV